MLRIYLFVFLGITFGTSALADSSNPNLMFEAEVGLHKLSSDFFSYQANKSGAKPDFVSQVTGVERLLRKANLVGDINSDSSMVSNHWSRFVLSINDVKFGNEAINRFDLTSVSDSKSSLLDAIRSESAGDLTDTQVVVLNQTRTLSSLIEAYSAYSLSLRGVTDEELAHLDRLCNEFESDLIALSSIGEKSIARINTRWKFIKPSILNIRTEPAVPFIVSHYGSVIINELARAGA